MGIKAEPDEADAGHENRVRSGPGGVSIERFVTSKRCKRRWTGKPTPGLESGNPFITRPLRRSLRCRHVA
jgi:hypothetical protein